jgi:hypothetical protein
VNRYNTKKCKHCGKATSVLAERVFAEWKVNGWREDVFVGEDGEVVGYSYGAGNVTQIRVPCRGCGAQRIARKVLGRVVHDIKCDGRCEGATGHVCDCQCGGKNHGRRHAA